MTSEFPKHIQAEDLYGLTEGERLHNRVNDARLQQILNDEDTAIHSVELSTNNYGEFLFIATSRSNLQQQKAITFWGLGLHEYRDRWIVDEWFYYAWNPAPGSDRWAATINKEEAREHIRQRKDEIAHYGTPEVQSKRGQFFEMLADLTDDDGAIAEMEDLGGVFDDDMLP